MLALLLVLAAIAYLKRDFARWAYHHYQFLGLQSRAMAHVAPPGTVALEQEAVAAAKLVAGGGDHAAGPIARPDLSPLGVGAQWRPAIFLQYWPAIAPGALPDGAVVYLGERTSPGGARRLILITTQSTYAIVSLLVEHRTFVAYVVDPATWRTPAVVTAGTLAPRLKSPHEPLKPLRIYAGQPDPRDPSRFTIDLFYDGKAGVVDGWLEDVGGAPVVRLKVRGGEKEEES